jgi:hypothetical protein
LSLLRHNSHLIGEIILHHYGVLSSRSLMTGVPELLDFQTSLSAREIINEIESRLEVK